MIIVSPTQSALGEINWSCFTDAHPIYSNVTIFAYHFPPTINKHSVYREERTNTIATISILQPNTRKRPLSTRFLSPPLDDVILANLY